MAVSLEIPVSGITILGGKPYINTAGLLYKAYEVARAHQGIKRITAEPLKDKDGNPMIAKQPGDTAVFIGRVEFQDGQVFEDIGEASVKNIKMSTIHPFLNSMAARRATNRALRLATGVGLVSAEEIGSEVQEETEPNRILTQAEVEEISDLIDALMGVDSKEKLEEVRKKIKERKEKLNEAQIKELARLLRSKEEEYGIL